MLRQQPEAPVGLAGPWIPGGWFLLVMKRALKGEKTWNQNNELKKSPPCADVKKIPPREVPGKARVSLEVVILALNLIQE